MGNPRQALNPTTHSVGFTAKLVTVSSVSADGKTAVCVDRQNVQTSVPMMIQRSKAPLPVPGETWLITQDLGTWAFAAIVATSSGQFASSDGSVGGTRVTVSATAPASPATGDVWVNGASGNAVFWWNGTSWISAQFGTQAIADRAITRAKIAPASITTAELDPAAGITAGQVAFSATEIGGVRIFIGTSQPPNPAHGDLWINPSQGNALYFWDNDRWTGLLIGAGAIAPGSLTTFQISPTAGITNGQVDFTARDIGGITTSVSSAQPTAPAIGDLWFDGTSNYVLRQWDGSAWGIYQFGTNAIAAGSVTAALIAANTITAAQIAAGTITATQIAAGTILASNIAAGTITATQIAAGSLTGSVIGNLGACLNKNPFFSGGDLTGWLVGGSGASDTILVGGSIPAGAPYGNAASSYAAQFTVTAGGGGNKFNGFSDRFGVVVGNRYPGTAWVYSASTVSLAFGFEFRNSSGTLVTGGTVTSTVTIPANTWTLLSVVATAPASSQTGNLVFIPQAAATIVVQAAQAFPQIQGIVDATTITGATFIAYGGNGEFLAYSATPAAGNMTASVSSAAAADPTANNYLQGVAGYTQGAAVPVYAVALQNGQVAFYRAAAGQGGTWVAGGIVSGNPANTPHTGELELQSNGSASSGMKLRADTQAIEAYSGIIADSGLAAAVPGGSTGATVAETWHVINDPGEPTYGTGFGASGGQQAPRFRLEAIGSSLNDLIVRLDGVAATTAATAAGARVFTLPAGYRPSQLKRFQGVASISGYTSANPGTTLFEVNTSGQVICVQAASGSAQVICFEGATFPIG